MARETGLALTALCYLLAAIAALSITVPQARRLVRLRHAHDGLGAFRLKTTVLFGSLSLLALRAAAVWIDFVFFGQHYLGTIDHRWGVDLALAALFLGGVLISAWLHWRMAHERGGD